ncbi:YigZ family protein [Flavobacteriaceae bacterium JJC]|uniref:YigZ family protein n=1 Tax=Kaistella soli TaxID=2849654 RepID=UPI000B4AD780|nr:YigZ family protein [Kaistella soli]MBU8881692.1 YigZ family protein [Kaistella soli]OWK74171.1 YigZ family protein [Flavobacteriaceae bacterium JJC]
MEFSFNTIKSAVENVLLKEKGSKFLSFVFPLNDENDLKKNLEKIRVEHPKATHHCYAFRLGMKGENYRANDDGEPSGSAGLPIYNQLLANDITNVLLIVVRYYGGTKLGVSGLVKAYKESAKLVLEEAEIITKELESDIEIAFSFSQQNQIFTLLNKFDGKIQDFLTDEKCTIKAKIKTSQKESISEQLSEMQNISFEFF